MSIDGMMQSVPSELKQALNHVSETRSFRANSGRAQLLCIYRHGQAIERVKVLELTDQGGIATHDELKLI